MMPELLKMPIIRADIKKHYPDIATFLWHVIVASEPLLEEAARVSNGKLKDYYTRHLEEERGHELWLAIDLEELGIDVDALPTDPIASAMAGSQYYILKHRDPAEFLGYMAFLEGTPMNPDLVAELESIYGEKAVRTLRYHSIHDVDHSSDLDKMIDSLSTIDREKVVQNTRTTVALYSMAMERINGHP